MFTEINSYIKGACDGKMDYTSYLKLTEGRSSTLTQSERRDVYEIYKSYERKKAQLGEFDLSDLVNDLHTRL